MAWSWPLVALLTGACASAPPAPFSRTPDDQIAVFPRAVVEPQPTRPEGVGAGQVAAVVTLRVQVDRTGVVRSARVIKSADPGHDQDAIDALMRARFQPAEGKDGQPVDCEITWQLDYSGR